MNCTRLAYWSVMLASILSGQFAYAIPVRLKGFVANLGGTPHTDPNIVVTVRLFPGGTPVASKSVDENGFFEIDVPPDRVPDADTRISIEASGTATIAGRRESVATRQPMIGLAGEVAAGLTARMDPASPARVDYFFIVDVPKKASSKCYCRSCVPKRACGRRRR